MSHGWVVAAVDQPYNPPAVRFPDGRVLRTLADAQRGWPPTDDPGQGLRAYRERNVHYARDVVFVIDRLGILDSSDGALARRLALEPGVGVVGHSRGGQAAGTVRLLDARVRAGINIDGVLDLLPVQPAPDVPGMGRQPFLWIQSAAAIGVPTDEELAQQGLTRAGFNARLLGRLGATLAAWWRGLATIEEGSMQVLFHHDTIEHLDFSDEPWWFGHVPPDALPAKTAIMTDARAWVRAFLDATVRADRSGLDALLAANPPGSVVSPHAFGPLAP